MPYSSAHGVAVLQKQGYEHELTIMIAITAICCKERVELDVQLLFACPKACRAGTDQRRRQQ
jgi:hypothetical protein